MSPTGVLLCQQLQVADKIFVHGQIICPDLNLDKLFFPGQIVFSLRRRKKRCSQINHLLLKHKQLHSLKGKWFENNYFLEGNG